MFLFWWRHAAYLSCHIPLLGRYLPLNFPLSVENFCSLSFRFVVLRRSVPPLSFVLACFQRPCIFHSSFWELGWSLRSISPILFSRIQNSNRSRVDGVEIAAVFELSKRVQLVKSFCRFLIAAVEFVPFKRQVLASSAVLAKFRQHAIFCCSPSSPYSLKVEYTSYASSDKSLTMQPPELPQPSCPPLWRGRNSFTLTKSPSSYLMRWYRQFQEPTAILM